MVQFLCMRADCVILMFFFSKQISSKLKETREFFTLFLGYFLSLNLKTIATAFGGVEKGCALLQSKKLTLLLKLKLVDCFFAH